MMDTLHLKSRACRHTDYNSLALHTRSSAEIRLQTTAQNSPQLELELLVNLVEYPADADSPQRETLRVPRSKLTPTLTVPKQELHLSPRQSHYDELVSFASLLAISGTFNSLSKVLFTFPSRYLFAIGLESLFS